MHTRVCKSNCASYDYAESFMRDDPSSHPYTYISEHKWCVFDNAMQFSVAGQRHKYLDHIWFEPIDALAIGE